MNLFYKCDTLEYISYINTSIPLISKTLTSLNCWISLLSSSFMALQEKTGDEQKRKQRVLGVHTAKPLASAPQPTLPAKRGQRLLNGPSRHSPYQGRRITLWHQFSKERTVPSCSLSFCFHAALSFILFYPC